LADSITEFAELFRERNNKKLISFEIGTVLSSSPLVVKLDQMKDNLDKNDLIIPTRLVNTFTVGDRISVLQSVDAQMYLIIDKVVG
jgi:hypothetical protein